jgi:NADH-quinone oxidoreductase subunit I
MGAGFAAFNLGIGQIGKAFDVAKDAIFGLNSLLEQAKISFTTMLGSGIIKGLAVTAKNFVGSYHDPARMVTEQYPEERPKLPEAYRNFPFLVTENATDPMGTLRCVACQICEKECPPQCIFIIKSKAKKPDHLGKPQLYPATFDIDFSVCMSCQICVEVCPFDAIKMDQEFELATPDRFDGLLRHKDRLARPNAYFQKLHPTDAGAIDTLRAAEAEKARVAAAAKAAATAQQAACTSPEHVANGVGQSSAGGSGGSGTRICSGGHGCSPLTATSSSR